MEPDGRNLPVLVLPGSGEVVAVDDAASVARAIQRVKELEGQVKDAKRTLTEVMIEHSMRMGTRTLRFDDAPAVKLTADSENLYDAEEIEIGLREAGMPEERIREIVVETTSYKVNVSNLKAAAGANPAYKAVMEANVRSVPKTVYAELI